MSDFFSLDSTDYPEYSNIIISFAQRSQENLPYQQFTDTGSLEYSNSKSLPLTPPEDQLILGESVNTSPLYSNNNSTDILNGEMRKASNFVSNAWGAVQDVFGQIIQPITVYAPSPEELAVNEIAYTPAQWQGEIYTWHSGWGRPSPFKINETLSNNSSFQLVGKVNLGSNTRYIPGLIKDNRNGINHSNWSWGSVNKNPRLPSDYFIVKAYTETYLEGGQTYRFEARGDDGYQIWLKKLDTNEWFSVTPENQWETTIGQQDTDIFPYKIPEDKGGQYYVVFFHYEVDQEAYFGLNWKKDLTPIYDPIVRNDFNPPDRILTTVDRVYDPLVGNDFNSPGQILKRVNTVLGLKNITVGSIDAGKNVNAALAAIRSFENYGVYGTNGGNVQGDPRASTSIGAYQESFASYYIPIGNNIMGTNVNLKQFYSGDPLTQDIAAIGRLDDYNKLLDSIRGANLYDETKRLEIAGKIVNAWGSMYSDQSSLSTPEEKKNYKLAFSQAILEALNT